MNASEQHESGWTATARARNAARRVAAPVPPQQPRSGGLGEALWSTCCILAGAALTYAFGPSFILVTIALLLLSRR